MTARRARALATLVHFFQKLVNIVKEITYYMYVFSLPATQHRTAGSCDDGKRGARRYCSLDELARVDSSGQRSSCGTYVV